MVVREIIGLSSIAIGILLLGVSFYLFLRRSRSLPPSQRRRSAVLTLIYGFFFCIIGLVIERTTPASYDVKTAEAHRDSLPVVSPKIVESPIDSAESEPEKTPPVIVQTMTKTPIIEKPHPTPEKLRIAKEKFSPVTGTMQPKQFVQRLQTDTDEQTTLHQRSKPLEDKIYETVDAFLSRIEAFFDRYAIPVPADLPSQSAVMFRPILFSDTTADIPPKYYYLLNEIARTLKQHPEIGTLEIRSYTDGEGPEVYNYLVTQSRANSVRDYLVAQGIKPERLLAKGYGATHSSEVTIRLGNFNSHRRIEFVPLPLDQTLRTR